MFEKNFTQKNKNPLQILKNENSNKNPRRI